MLPFLIDKQTDKPLVILCLGAHPDDIEIGCGGTILRLCKERQDVVVRWIIFSGSESRQTEARASAAKFLANAGSKKVETLAFQDGYFPYIGEAIKNNFEQLKSEIEPDIVFTHYREDRHQDHRLINELTWNTFRHHLILEYEVPKYDGDMGQPNAFVPIDEVILNQKIEYLLTSFASQKDRHWFSEDTFRALPRLRGMESALTGKYAEAFYNRKALLSF